MKKLLIVIGVFIGFSAGPALAQDDLLFSSRATRACLGAAASLSEKQQCVGASADACIAATPLGGSTYGMGGCLNFEAQWWDERLNTTYSALMQREKADDAEMLEFDSAAPQKAVALRAMQRAWIPFRDATCDYERSLWGGGTGGGPATVACYLRLTGQQTLYLEESLAGY